VKASKPRGCDAHDRVLPLSDGYAPPDDCVHATELFGEGVADHGTSRSSRRIGRVEEPPGVRLHLQRGEVVVGHLSDPDALNELTYTHVLDGVVIDGGNRGERRRSRLDRQVVRIG
jgi:hypothetical protein